MISSKHFRDSLLMFRDLGLTPREMSKFAEIPLKVIEEGLKRLETDGSRANSVPMNWFNAPTFGKARR